MGGGGRRGPHSVSSVEGREGEARPLDPGFKTHNGLNDANPVAKKNPLSLLSLRQVGCVGRESQSQ